MRTTRTADVSERLAREVGLLAGRLAQSLAESLALAEGAVAEGHAFLKAMAEAAAGGLPPSAWQGTARERRPAGAPHPLDRLADALALSLLEVDLLLLAGMAEEHEGFAAVLRTLHPRGEPRASVGLAAQLFCRGPRERLHLRTLLETGPVVTGGVLRLTGDAPFFERSLQPAEALWPALHGIDAWPPTLARFDGPVADAGLEEWLAGPGPARAAAALRRRGLCTVLVTADSEDSAFRRALALVHATGLEWTGVSLPPVVDAELERLLQVHTLVRGTVPVLRLAPGDGPPVPEVPAFAGYPGTVVVCGRVGAVSVRGSRPLLPVPVERLTSAAGRRMWRETVPDLADQASVLAARYPVEPAAAAEVAADLRFLETLDGRPRALAEVAAGIRARGALSLSGGVKLLRPHATFAHLVLAPDRLAQLREAADRLALQARVFDEWGFLNGRPGTRGVRLLFAGPPGTGKTLAAEVLAHELGVDLLIVDISRVVSKWIGETEKNLAAVFDTAERAQAVLFFDEADALFGKRTEVSDAHDRYANLETAYLLARLERFEGLAILATNFRQNIDPAFLRRLEAVLDFDEPDREQRHALWRCHLPPGAPLAADVSLPELAALYPVVGGVIRNAAVAAAFLAAAAGPPITRRHLVHALRREYEKAGKAFPGVPAGLTVS
jgi:hypothetical protein